MVEPRIAVAASGTLSSGARAAAFTTVAAIAAAPPAGAGAHLRALDGLRALTALRVFFVHYIALFAYLIPQGSPTARTLHAIFISSLQGANLFFVLSGFLIYRSLLRRPHSLGKYLVRRVRRIYPTFGAVLILYLALSVLFPARSKLPAEGASQFILANAALLPGVFPVRPVITVAWTLSYELFFYFAISTVVIGLGMRTWSPSSRALFLLGTAVLYLAVGDAFGLRLGPFLLFLPGMLLFDLLDQRSMARRPLPAFDLRPCIPMVGTGILAALSFADLGLPVGGLDATAETLRANAGIGLVFALLLWMAVGGSRRFSSFCMWGPLRWLGEMTYSFYLIHGLVLGGIAMLLKPLLPPGEATILFWIGLPLALGGAVAVAWVLYVGIEKRFSFVRPAAPAAP